LPLAASRRLQAAIVESLRNGAHRLTGDRERRHELAQRLSLGVGGGAVGCRERGAGHRDVQANVPIGNIVAMFDAVKRR
jgi:hypothetical protein